MRAIRILFSFVGFLLVGCQGITGQGSYQPSALPLKVSVDTHGKVSFDLVTSVEYPTPLGTFSVGVVVDPVEYFDKDHTLTVRIDCEDNFYDLHGKDFSVQFESGYYERINLTKQGGNILLELRHLGENNANASTACPMPLAQNQSPKQDTGQNATSDPFSGGFGSVSGQVGVQNVQTSITTGDVSSVYKSIDIRNGSNWPIRVLFIYWGQTDNPNLDGSPTGCYPPRNSVQLIEGPTVNLGSDSLTGQPANSTATYKCDGAYYLSIDTSTEYAPVCIVYYPLNQNTYAAVEDVFGGQTVSPLMTCGS